MIAFPVNGSPLRLDLQGPQARSSGTAFIGPTAHPSRISPTLRASILSVISPNQVPLDAVIACGFAPEPQSQISSEMTAFLVRASEE